MEPLVTTKPYEIHYFDTDLKKKATLTRMMNFFDDIVFKQSDGIGFGMEYFARTQTAWMIYQWDITVHRYPVYEEVVHVRTTPLAMNKFYGRRKFEIFDADGKLLVHAHSVWIFVDSVKKRPSRVPEEMCHAYGIAKDKGEIPIFEAPEIPGHSDFEREFDVVAADIDSNGHVNNVKYAEWSLETLPMDLLMEYSIKNIKIMYKKETKYADRVKISASVIKEGETITCFHQVSDPSGTELCLLESKWIKG